MDNFQFSVPLWFFIENIYGVEDVGDVSAVAGVGEEVADGIVGKIKDGGALHNYPSLNFYLEWFELSIGFGLPLGAHLKGLHVAEEEIWGLLHFVVFLAHDEGGLGFGLEKDFHKKI